MKSGSFLKPGIYGAVVPILCMFFIACSSGKTGVSPPDTTAEPAAVITRTYNWETEPAAAQVTESVFTHGINYYAVTAGQRDILTPSGYEAYCRTIDAFLNASESVGMTADQADTVVPALADCFPPVWLAQSIAFVPGKADTITEDMAEEAKPGLSGEAATEQNAVQGTLKIIYKYDEAEHTAKIGDFFNRIAYIMNDSGAADAANSEAAVILLYRYTAKTVTDVAGKRTSSYSAIMYGSGEADGDIKYAGGGSHALAYIYLLLQSGIECTAVTGSFHASPWMICAVIIGGSLFYCDPAGEMNATAGSGLKYFGLNDRDLLADGLTEPLRKDAAPLFLFDYIPAVRSD